MNNNFTKENYKAYEIAMSFLENESSKKNPAIGSKSWIRLRDDLNFLDKKKSDRIVNWLMENWPPKPNRIMPRLTETELHAFDPEAHKLLLRSYKTGMVSSRFIDDIIARSRDIDDMHFSEKFLQSCLARIWDDSMQEVQNTVLH